MIRFDIGSEGEERGGSGRKFLKKKLSSLTPDGRGEEQLLNLGSGVYLYSPPRQKGFCRATFLSKGNGWVYVVLLHV